MSKPGSIFRLLAHGRTTLSVAYDLVRLLVLGMRSRRESDLGQERIENELKPREQCERF